MSKRNYIVPLFVLMTALLFIAGGVSYAAYSFLGIGMKEITISTSGVAFRYTEGKNKIELSEVMPLTDEQGKNQNNYFEFEVSAYTDDTFEVPYDITVKKSDDSGNIDDAIKLYLTKVDRNGNEEEIKLVTLDKANKYINNEINLNNIRERLLYSTRVPKGVGYNQKYRLRMWVSYDADYTQAKYNNAKFSLTVNVYGNGKKEVTSGNRQSNTLNPGLYDSNNNLLVSWDSLINDYKLSTENTFDSIVASNQDLALGTKLVIGNVDKIEEDAYIGNKTLKTVVIPNTVTEVEDRAFAETAIETVTFDSESQLQTIGIEAFDSCQNLNELTIPSTVTTIGENAFKGIEHIIYTGSALGSPWGASYIN